MTTVVLSIIITVISLNNHSTRTALNFQKLQFISVYYSTEFNIQCDLTTLFFILESKCRCVWRHWR